MSLELSFPYRFAVQASLLHLVGIIILFLIGPGLHQDAGLSKQQALTDAVLMLMQHDEHESSVTDVLLAEAPVAMPVPKAAPIKKVRQAIGESSKPPVPKDGRATQALEALPEHEYAQPTHALNPPPDYPITLRQRGIEGTVWLRVRVDRSGLPEQIILFKTSGYRLFDEAALRAVARWRFRPARSNGQYLASWVEFPVRFILQG
jgi:TonB family protein